MANIPTPVGPGFAPVCGATATLYLLGQLGQLLLDLVKGGDTACKPC